MYRIKLLTVLLSVLLSANMFAQEKMVKIDYANWMSQLPPETKLTDLSIPVAHDAATWSWNLERRIDALKKEDRLLGDLADDAKDFLKSYDLSLFIKDQDLSERQMFKKGVRGFDMRLHNYDHIHGDFFSEMKNGLDKVRNSLWVPLVIRKGLEKISDDQLRTLSNVFCTLNSMEEELGCMPSPEELGQETLFIWFKTDGAYNSNTEVINKYNSYVKYMDLLKRYYKDRIVSYHKGLTLGDLRGKVVVICGDDLLKPEKYESMSHSKEPCPIPITVTKVEEHGNFNYVMYDYVSNDTLYGFHQDDWQKTTPKDKFEVFKKNMEKFHNSIDDVNSQGYLNYAAVNAYDASFDEDKIKNRQVGGEGVAADKKSVGANHYVNDYLINRHKPYGFVAFDFCGTDKDGKHGDTLLKTIVKNNFIREHTEYFISELVTCNSQEEESADSLLIEEGYSVLSAPWTTKNGEDKLKFGVRYTDKPEEALSSDVLLVSLEFNINDFPTITYKGKTYNLVKNFTSQPTSSKYDNFGNIDNGFYNEKYYPKTSKYYLYTRKAEGKLNEGLLTRLGIVTYEPEFKVQLEISKPYDGWSWYQSPYFGSDGTRSLEIMKHKFHAEYQGVEDNSIGYHLLVCEHCPFTIKEQCTIDASSNGFGECMVCHATTFKGPGQKDGVFQIENDAQLFWFANYVNNEKCDAKAVLTADIEIREVKPTDIENRPWTPIGTREKPFSGVFDGQGHTISGIYCVKRSDFSGLFGTVNGGTVRNLGIINSVFSGYDYVGAFAGYSKDATFENIYSTSVSELLPFNGNDYNSHQVRGTQYYFTGGLIGCLENTTVRNAYFNGWFSINDPARQPLGADMPQSNNIVENVYAPDIIKPLDFKLRNFGKVKKISNVFASSGQLCLLLNRDDNIDHDVWYQKLGKDGNPTLHADENARVYGGYKHCGYDDSDSDLIISNDPSKISEGYAHIYPHNADPDPEYIYKYENHNLYYKAEYTWKDNEDFTKATVTMKFTCDVCGKTEIINKEGELLRGTYPNCTLEGHNYYSATYQFNDSVYTTTYDQIVPAWGGHVYREGGFGCERCIKDVYQPAELVDGKYEISNAGQLYWFQSHVANHHSDANAILTNDIVINKDMSLDESQLRHWTPICTKGGDHAYCGTFDGNGHTISGLFYANDHQYMDYVGLFSTIGDGSVKNLGIINSRFISDKTVGSFAGFAGNTHFDNIYSTATIEAKGKTLSGGFVGWSFWGNIITNGFFKGNIIVEDPESNELQYRSNAITPTHIPSRNTISNIYVPEGKYSNTNGAIEVPDSIFKSGQLCLLLNDSTYGKDAIWRQNIDASTPDIDASTPDEDRYEGTYLVDTIPVLKPNHDMVVPAQYNGKDFINLHVRYDGDSIRYYRDMFDVSDQHNFSCPVDFAVMYANQTRDMKGYTWGTVCLPFDIDDTKNGNVRLFKIVAIDETDAESAGLYIEEIDKLPAGKPAICAKMDEEQNTIKFICDDGCTIYSAKERQKFISVPEKTTYNQLKLWGTYSCDTLSYDNTKNIYAFRTDKDRFTKLEPADKIRSKPFRGWIETYNPSNTLHYNPNIRTAGIDVVEGDEVIDDVNIQLPMYDLSGRRVLTPFRGKIIIRKGKKILYNNK